MGVILVILWFSYVFWGPILILALLTIGAKFSANRLIFAPVYLPLSALGAAIVAAPRIIGTEGFALPGPWWFEMIWNHSGHIYIFGSFINTVGIFILIGLGITLMRVAYRAIKSKPRS